MIGNSDDETNFSQKLLLTNGQVVKLRKAFADYLSVDIQLSKTQLSKIVQSEVFLGRLLGPLLKTGLLLMKNVLQPLAKSVLIPLGLTAASSAADSKIHKYILESGSTILKILNEAMEDIMKIVKSLKNSGLLIKGKTIQNEAKYQKGRFLSMLLGTLRASLLENMLKGWGVKPVNKINRAEDGIIRAGYES